MNKVIVFLIVGILLSGQFHVSQELYGGIEASNYFALLLGGMAAVASLIKVPKMLYWGDMMAFILFGYLLVHAYATQSMQSQEFHFSISYFAIYAAFRVLKGMRVGNYITFAVMVCGIYQSCIVLEQLLGNRVSNHHLFVVTGSFFNPGPCGIFLSGVFVLAAAMMKKRYRKAGFNLMFVRYVTACTAFCTTLLALVPTMSRAGWLGAAVGVLLVYRREIGRRIRGCRRWAVVGGGAGLLAILLLSYLLKKDSADGRLFIWQHTISAWAESPIFGVGIDGFERSYAKAQHDYFEQRQVLEQEDGRVEMAGVVESAFNEPLALVLLLGVTGGVLAGAILFFKLRRLTDYACVAVALLVASFFSYTFYIPSIALLFLIALAQLPDRPLREMPGGNVLVYGSMCGVALFFNLREYGKLETYRNWKKDAVYYTSQDYEGVTEAYGKLYPVLKNNFKFLFEYGHSLNKTGEYAKSNAILEEGTRHSADPMFWNIIGNNYLGLKEYDLSEAAYLRAYYTCPNRVYPLYLLTKLEAARGDTAKMEHYGRLLLGKRPKVPSLAVDEMKFEVRRMLEEGANNEKYKTK